MKTKLTLEQELAIQRIIMQWHEAGRAEFERSYTNLDYDSPTYSKHYATRGKYIALDTGTSGAFMVEIETGLIYGIKAYGSPNKKKIYGEAWNVFDGATLHKARYLRGSFDLRFEAKPLSRIVIERKKDEGSNG